MFGTDIIVIPAKFKNKRYDGRYHTAKMLYYKACQQRTCRWCQSEWFIFYADKIDKVWGFLAKERWECRRRDPDWRKHNSKNAKTTQNKTVEKP